MDPLLPGKVADLDRCREDLKGRLSQVAGLLPNLTGEGVSYLDLKNSLLLHYTTLVLGAMGPEREALLPALIQTKSLLERLRPLDVKLQYQLDKIAKGNVEAELSFKPNPEAMSKQLRVTEKSDVYIPPKLQAVEPDLGTKGKKAAREEEFRKRQLAQSAFLEDLRAELGEEPVEIKTDVRNRKLKAIEDREERYEEENYTRVVLSKREKQVRKRLRGREDEQLDDLEDISKFLKQAEAPSARVSKRN